jgi:hypothetical protein
VLLLSSVHHSGWPLSLDLQANPSDNAFMSTIELPPEVLTAMEQAARFAATGQGDSEVLGQIHTRAEQIRAEILQKHGLLDIAVPAIRELRDAE